MRLDLRVVQYLGRANEGLRDGAGLYCCAQHGIVRGGIVEIVSDHEVMLLADPHAVADPLADGVLWMTVAEREQLTSLVDWSKSLSRARALRLLGEQPV